MSEKEPTSEELMAWLDYTQEHLAVSVAAKSKTIAESDRKRAHDREVITALRRRVESPAPSASLIEAVRGLVGEAQSIVCLVGWNGDKQFYNHPALQKAIAAVEKALAEVEKPPAPVEAEKPRVTMGDIRRLIKRLEDADAARSGTNSGLVIVEFVRSIGVEVESREKETEKGKE